MWPRTDLIELLGIDHPIIQAPMSGSDSPVLAAAVSNAGGMGSLGCGEMSIETLRERFEETRSATKERSTMVYNTGSPLNGFNPWVVAVGTTANGGNAKRRIPRSPAIDAKHGRQAGPIGLVKRFRLLLQSA